MILGYTKGIHCLFSLLCFLLCIPPVNTLVHWWHTGWWVIWGLVDFYGNNTGHPLLWNTYLQNIYRHDKMMCGYEYSSDVNTQTHEKLPPTEDLVVVLVALTKLKPECKLCLKDHSSYATHHVLLILYKWPFSNACHQFFRLANKAFLQYNQLFVNSHQFHQLHI